MDEKILNQLSIELGKRLKRKKLSVTCAESCTGGWIAKVITDIAGSSAYFNRGFVTYSNDAKHEMLGVLPESLAQFGAVSEQIVKEMATGALIVAKADVSVAVSGIAGPEGGSEEKPTGTVWFGFAFYVNENIQTVTYRQHFSGGRNAVRLQAVLFSLKTLLDEIIKN
ncbi:MULTISPECIES: nicotinamide-nucleotide amidase [Xenorhabdus]|uniref:Competence damage-inducible protein A n=1 Tax=Xenorhabdus ehlersii TaxID=290111 RepID=A0A2D0IXT0_9GAMM|nr:MULTISPECIES: nicotinamide-nucleotide amidase [Xenorhabdus]MBC8947651.1 competence damage-inducible protein A [Xenorhabdus sp. TS4]MBC8947770.1 competence damage-inducible protein A [Xenorhabdus sp. TS4]MBC8947964.1 competence damage-inducible protein A [Xenorhabdus sp. TS4]PHM26726.1 competence damage-inducible protein A [Xenorhabdus ehlersii]RKE93252.1 nicotinamide-nucleotide amidase [Xenorhabdus ehlersii]